MQESGNLLAACLEDKGWSAFVDTDGGVVSEYPPNQESRYTEDLDACIDEVGVGGPIDYSQEQYEALYEGLLESQRCLLDEFGYETPTAPSLPAFVELKGAWSPFALLPVVSAEEFTEVQKVCPQPTL